MVGKDLIMATLLGGSSGGGSGIPQEDIDAAFAALAEKGVTVPDGATSADLDKLIASIVTGGGGVVYTTGSFTPAKSITLNQNNTNPALVIEHGLGVKPDLFIFGQYGAAYNYALDVFIYRSGKLTKDGSDSHVGFVNTSAGTSGRTCSHSGCINWPITENVMPIIPSKATSPSTVIVPPVEYLWIAIGGMSE